MMEPRRRACIIAPLEGLTSASTLRAPLRICQKPISAGIDTRKPAANAGTTKSTPWMRTIKIRPHLVMPTIRCTPISKVFVSTLMTRSEYISNTEIITRRMTTRSKIIATNITQREQSARSSRRGFYNLTGKNPRDSSMSLKYLDTKPLTSSICGSKLRVRGLGKEITS